MELASWIIELPNTMPLFKPTDKRFKSKSLNNLDKDTKAKQHKTRWSRNIRKVAWKDYKVQLQTIIALTHVKCQIILQIKHMYLQTQPTHCLLFYGIL